MEFRSLPREAVCGVVVAGEAWRRLQSLRETHGSPKSVLRVAGVTFRKDALAAVVDDACEFVPEPSNPHDPAAIRVEVGGQHVGYVPRGVPLAAGNPRLLSIGTIYPHVWIAFF